MQLVWPCSQRCSTVALFHCGSVPLWLCSIVAPFNRGSDLLHAIMLYRCSVLLLYRFACDFARLINVFNSTVVRYNETRRHIAVGLFRKELVHSFAFE